MILTEFKIKVESSFESIRSLEDLRGADRMVDEVFIISKEIIAKDLDTMDLGWLVSKGGRLAGIYAYLGNKYARARAERDIYEQKKEEVYNKLTVDYYSESESKITLARARAKEAIAPIEELITIKEYEKKTLENLLTATERLVGFIQSAIKVKQSEKFVSRELSDNV